MDITQRAEKCKRDVDNTTCLLRGVHVCVITKCLGP